MSTWVLSLALVTALLSASGPAAAQTVDEVVAKAYQAKGGAKWTAIQSMRMRALLKTQAMEMPMIMVALRPNLMRQDITIPAENITIVQGFDGEKGWSINPMVGAEATEMAPAEAESMKDQADFDGPLIDYKAKGNTVELVGTEDIGGAKAHHLKITKKRGQVLHLYIDVARGVELKSISEVDMGSGLTKVETELSDYRPVDGILVPFAMRVKGGPAGPVSITVDKVEFNVVVDDKIFKRPAK